MPDLSDAIRAELEGAVLPLERIYADALAAAVDVADEYRGDNIISGAAVIRELDTAIARSLGIAEEER